MAADTHAHSRHTNPPPHDARWEYTLHVPHDARAIGIARSTLHAVLVRHELPALIDTATLLATELLTNAYVHAEGPASLRLRRNHRTLRLGVWDTHPEPPAEASGQAGAEGETGRGLPLIKAYADDWGWFLLGDDLFGTRGKYTWCDLKTAPNPPGTPGPEEWKRTVTPRLK